MNLGSKARYAVMAMVELARRGSDAPVTLAELAQPQELTLPYLEQIFLRLRQQGLVHSVRGPGGGYTLAKPADELTIAAIIHAMDESIKMTRCESDHYGCRASKSRCLTHDLWKGLSEHIESYLTHITLQDVVARTISNQFEPEQQHA